MKVNVEYICDNCRQAQPVKSWVYQCIRCGKEICESCTYGWATCKECAREETEHELEARFDRVFAEFVT